MKRVGVDESFDFCGDLVALGAEGLELGSESGQDEGDAARAAVLSASGIARTFGEDGSLMLIPADVRGRLAELLDGEESDADAAAREQLMAPLPSPFAVAPPHPRLTKREFIVLSELQSHNSNAEIATILGISANTVKTQLRSAYRKLEVRDRSQALVRMAVLGITGTAAESSAREPNDAS